MAISTVITIEVPFNEPEFCQMLSEKEVSYKTPGDSGLAFDSFMMHLFVNIVESPYTLPSLASVCVAYLSRNKGKSISIKQGDKTINIKGYSTDEVKQLLESATRVQITSDSKE